VHMGRTMVRRVGVQTSCADIGWVAEFVHMVSRASIGGEGPREGRRRVRCGRRGGRITQPTQSFCSNLQHRRQGRACSDSSKYRFSLYLCSIVLLSYLIL